MSCIYWTRLHGPLSRTRGKVSMRTEEVEELHLGYGWKEAVQHADSDAGLGLGASAFVLL